MWQELRIVIHDDLASEDTRGISLALLAEAFNTINLAANEAKQEWLSALRVQIGQTMPPDLERIDKFLLAFERSPGPVIFSFEEFEHGSLKGRATGVLMSILVALGGLGGLAGHVAWDVVEDTQAYTKFKGDIVRRADDFYERFQNKLQEKFDNLRRDENYPYQFMIKVDDEKMHVVVIAKKALLVEALDNKKA